MCSKFVEENYDVVVVGAGHAGCEAALACARRVIRISVEARRGISSGRLMHLAARWEKILTRPLSSQRC